MEARELDESSDAWDRSLASGEGSNGCNVRGRLPFLVGRGILIAPGCAEEMSASEAARFDGVRDGKLLGRDVVPLDRGFIGEFVNPKYTFVPIGSSRPTALTSRMNTPTI